LAQRHGQRQKILGAPLKREREPDEKRRLIGARDGVDEARQLGAAVERQNLRVKARLPERRGQVAQAQVLLELGPDERDPRHATPGRVGHLILKDNRRAPRNDLVARDRARRASATWRTEPPTRRAHASGKSARAASSTD